MWHRFNHTNGFGVKFLTHRADNLDITYLSSFVNDKLHKHSSLNIVFGSNFRIFDILLQKVDQSFHAAREFWHLLNGLIDLVILSGGLVCYY